MGRQAFDEMAWLEDTANCIGTPLPPITAIVCPTPFQLAISETCATGSLTGSVALHQMLLFDVLDKVHRRGRRARGRYNLQDEGTGGGCW
jgi:hypothetical protein